MTNVKSIASAVLLIAIVILTFIVSAPSTTSGAATSRSGTVGLQRRVNADEQRHAAEQLENEEEQSVANENDLAHGVEVRSATVVAAGSRTAIGEGAAQLVVGGGSSEAVAPVLSTQPSSGDAVSQPPQLYYQRIIPTAEDAAVTAAHERAMALGGASYFAWLADTPDMPLAPWKPGKATPITCEGHGDYYSGHFSIPPENLLPVAALEEQLRTGKRSRDWSTVIPYVKSTYVFKTEESYRADMEMSKFGVTRRKLGFATMRNLELMAAGTIPYFCSADKIPKTGTLASLPLGFYRMVNQMPGVGMRCYPKQKSRVYPIAKDVFNATQYAAAARKMLEWTHLYQRTDYHALYVLSATSLTALPKSVLVLWASHYTILLTTLIHGLASLGVSVTDVPRRLDTYKSPECEANKSQTYAKGWFFFCKVEESAGISRDNVEERIRQKAFDLIIISVTDTLTYHMKDPSVEIPYFDAIASSYPRDRVLTINDADLIRPMQYDVAHKMMHNMSLYFKRETHGCNEDIMYKRM